MGSGGEPSGTGGVPTPLAAPWEELYGHYDLMVIPDDAECEGLVGHVNFSLRAGESGPEARIFRNFEWNGWPDVVVEDAPNSGLWIRPGSGASLDGATTEEGVFLPYDEGGFLMPGVPAGHAVVRSTCDDSPIEQPALVSIRADQTSPHVRERLTTRFNFYPFTWLMFRFSEPLGFTTDSYPWGSFTTIAEGTSLLELRGNHPSASPPGEFTQWPWGPVVGMKVTDPSYRTGGSIWFQLVGEEFDAAGNELVTDLPIYGVLDLGPLEARHEFDTEPPLLGWMPAEHVAPGAGNLCENDGGCVVVSQYPDSCDLEGNLVGSPPGQFAFRVGGPDVPGGLVGGIRIRYRYLAMGDYPSHANSVFAQSGVADYTQAIAAPVALAQPVGGYPYASPWSETVFQDPMTPTNDFGIAISWECPYEVQPHRALVIEWAEATVP